MTLMERQVTVGSADSRAARLRITVDTLYGPLQSICPVYFV